MLVKLNKVTETLIKDQQNQEKKVFLYEFILSEESEDVVAVTTNILMSLRDSYYEVGKVYEHRLDLPQVLPISKSNK